MSVHAADRPVIRRRILEALARQREPGLYFAGHLLGLLFESTGPRERRVSMPAGPHCEDADGQVDVGAVALLADTALASAARVDFDVDARFATVSMHLQFTGAPLRGALAATGWPDGRLADSAGPQGLSHVSVSDAAGRQVVFGTGAFMPVPLPPGLERMPPIPRGDRKVDPLDEAELDAGERRILARADAALDEATPRHGFIRRFLGIDPHATSKGAACTLGNGAHVSNRGGFVQGGILAGLAATTACAALPDSWMLSAISAWFTSPGEGHSLRAVSRLVHHGRQTAVVRTVITGPGRKRVLEAVTTHAHARRG